jgi:hypothetical protein
MTKKLDKDVLQGVVFAILMENNDGILQKSPSYVYEKWLAVRNLPEPENLLDGCNQAKLNEWKMRWVRESSDKET